MQFNPKNPKHMANWFDVHDPQHVEAYRYLRQHAQWPDWFLELREREQVVFHDYWENLIRSKLVDAWLNHVNQ